MIKRFLLTTMAVMAMLFGTLPAVASPAMGVNMATLNDSAVQCHAFKFDVVCTAQPSAVAQINAEMQRYDTSYMSYLRSHNDKPAEVTRLSVAFKYKRAGPSPGCPPAGDCDPGLSLDTGQKITDSIHRVKTSPA